MILLKLCFNVSQVYESMSFGDFMIFLGIINCFCSLTDWPVSLIKTKVHKKIYRILLRLSVQQKINLLWRVFVEIVKTGIYIFNPWRIILRDSVSEQSINRLEKYWHNCFNPILDMGRKVGFGGVKKPCKWWAHTDFSPHET